MESPPHPPSASASPGGSETDYRRLFDLSLDLLCVATIEGYFRLVNPMWTKVLGWSESELLARPVADFMHPDDRERTLQARSLLAQGIPLRGLENRYLCKDGSYRWLSWQSAIDPTRQTVYAVARDITDRRKQDQEHLALTKFESTGILAGGVAHDFNNLLATVRLTLDMIGLSGPLNPQQSSCVRQAVDAVDTAKAITQQLVTFAQGGTPAPEVMDIKPLLHHSVQFALAESPVKVDLRLATNLWPIEVDKVQFSEVVFGLVSNAREATPPTGHIRVTAENVVLDGAENLPPGDYVRITVSDNGSGIAPNILSKVFDPYFSTKQRGSRKGMGMGLTLCRSILQKHRGAIRIESAPGQGTTVVCHLPARPAGEVAPRD